MRKSAKKQKREATNEERLLARRLGGRRTFNSGAGDEKGDGRVMGRFRIESKYTNSPSYRLTGKEFYKLWYEATMAGEEPVFVVRLPIPGTLSTYRLVAIQKSYAKEIFPARDGVGPLVQYVMSKRGAKSFSLSVAAWHTAESISCARAVMHMRLALTSPRPPIHGRRIADALCDIIVLDWEKFCELTGCTE
jgi:hypothetical protein